MTRSSRQRHIWFNVSERTYALLLRGMIASAKSCNEPKTPIFAVYWRVKPDRLLAPGALLVAIRLRALLALVFGDFTGSFLSEITHQLLTTLAYPDLWRSALFR